MKDSQDNLIVIKKSNIKKVLFGVFGLMIKINKKFDSYAEIFWTKLLAKEPRLLMLVKNKYIRPVFTTVLLSFFGKVLGGLIGQVIFVFLFSNIMALLIGEMDWVKKLGK